jgi:UDP-N-acetylmuramoyl-L-alanyl-D-glutamate--2,6-diaminopimelate ligase
MKLLRDILYKTNLQEVHGSTNIAVTSITFDSRKVVKDSLFVAIKGTQSDGHTFIDKAIESGAIAIVCVQSRLDSWLQIFTISHQNRLN